MHIFVINLEKDAARRRAISAQLEALGLEYEIVPAVYGASLTDAERARLYDDRKAKLQRARSLVPAEIGCALSHLKVYRTIIERGMDCALILEDDVNVPSALPAFLDEFAQRVETTQPSVWLLSPAAGDESVPSPVAIGGSHRLLPYRSGYYTSSYIVTGSAARALLAELHPVADVADCWLRLARYRVVDLSVVSPPLIEQNQEEFGSSTTSDLCASGRSGALQKAIYKLRRVRAIVWDFLYAPYRRWFRPYAGLKFENGQ